MESIIDTFAKDAQNEAVMREVKLLYNIQLCQRFNTQTVPDFVGRYNRAVERFEHDKTEIKMFENQQCAIIMLRNAKITSKL